MGRWGGRGLGWVKGGDGLRWAEEFLIFRLGCAWVMWRLVGVSRGGLGRVGVGPGVICDGVLCAMGLGGDERLGCFAT